MKNSSFAVLLLSVSLLAGCSSGCATKPQVVNNYYGYPKPGSGVGDPATVVKPADTNAPVRVTAVKPPLPLKPKAPAVPVLSSCRPSYSLKFINRTSEVVTLDLNHGGVKVVAKPGESLMVKADASNNQIPYEAAGKGIFAAGTIRVDADALHYTIVISSPPPK